MLFLGVLAWVWALPSSTTYANYSSNQITSGDMRAIMDSIGFSTTDAKLLNFTGSFNIWSNANNINLLNCIFFNYNGKLYVTLGNGSVGNDYPQIAVFYLSGSISIREFSNWVYSGDKIISANYQSLSNVYQIAENITTKVTNASVPSWSGQSPPLADLDDPYIGVSTAVVTFPTYSVASWQTNNLYAWRFYNQYVQLSTWVQPTPIPTPTDTVTPTTVPTGSTDLTETNNKIDQVNESINNLSEQLSGDHQQTIETLTNVPSGDDFQDISSGDIINNLGLATYDEPYSSVWSGLIDGLSTALTCTELEYITINFLGHDYRLDVINVDYGSEFNQFLEFVMVVLPVLAILVFWRYIYISVMSGKAIKVSEYFANCDWADFF